MFLIQTNFVIHSFPFSAASFLTCYVFISLYAAFFLVRSRDAWGDVLPTNCRGCGYILRRVLNHVEEIGVDEYNEFVINILDNHKAFRNRFSRQQLTCWTNKMM